jgi:hypothetical protein
MPTPKIKNAAILIGFDASGCNVYSESIVIHEYYDSEHLWDNPKKITKIKLQKLIGYLFDPKGKLAQEFHLEFDPKSGEQLKSWVKFEDGTINESKYDS